MCFPRQPRQPAPIVNTPDYKPEDAYKHMDIWEEENGKVTEVHQGNPNGEEPEEDPKPTKVGFKFNPSNRPIKM